MDVVSDHEQIIFNLEFFKTFTTNVSSRNFSTQDLASHKITANEDEFHLIKNEKELILDF